MVSTSILTIATLMIAGALAELVRGFHLFPVAQAWGVLVATAFICAALALRTRAVAPRLAIMALVVQLATIMSTHASSNARTSASIGIFVTTYLTVVALPRRAAAWSIGGLCLLWLIVVSPNQMPIEAWGHHYNIRWMTLIQLVASAVLLWRIWFPELDAIAESDAKEREAYGGLIYSLRTQERLAAWRQAVVRTHETTLNDIRYVLSATSIDGPRLLEMLVRRPEEDEPSSGDRSLLETLEAAAAAESDLDVSIDGDRTRLERKLADTVRVVAVEVLRNSRRHADATSTMIRAWSRAGVLTVSFTHNGTAHPGEPSSGIGSEIALRDSVVAAGGTLDTAPHSLTVTLPLERSASNSVEIAALQTARLVLSAVMAGNAIGGVGFALLLAAIGTSRERMAAVLALTAFAGAAWAVRPRSTQSAATQLFSAAAATAVPVLVAQQADCSRLALSAMVAVLTLYAMCAFFLLAERKALWALGIVPLAAVVWLSARVPHACATQTQPALLSAWAAPALLGIAYWTSQLSLNQARRRRELALEDAAAAAKAHASRDAAARLHASVTAATATMLRVAATGTLDADDRQALRCLDSSIRASVQVDPQTSGGFALAAEELVQSACAAGVATRVLTLRDSGDWRQVPGEILDAARALLLADSGGVPTLQVLTAPGEDTMLVTTSIAGLARSGLESDSGIESQGCSAEVECDRESDVAVLIVRRVTRRTTSPSSHVVA